MMDSDDETERIIQGPMRGAVHQHLLRNGYIKERTTVDARGALVVVTEPVGKHCATGHKKRRI